MITGYVREQHLTLENTHIVADTIDYLEAKFLFKTDDWDGLTKWVHFANGDAVYDIRLTDDCIRKDDHLNLTAGVWKVCLHGNEFRDGEVVQRITTDAVPLYVNPTGVISGEPFPTIPPSAGEQIIASAQLAEAGAKEAAYDAQSAVYEAKTASNAALESANNAEDSAIAAKKSEENAYASETAAKVSELNAKSSETNSKNSESTASQALADFLRMLGTDVATLVNGKIPVSQIPSIATVEVYHAASLDEMNALEVQRGDICIRTDESKSYIFDDGWVYLASPTDYASHAGYADTAGTAENANTINGHRLVQIPWAAWESAVKDPDTYYLVYTTEESE